MLTSRMPSSAKPRSASIRSSRSVVGWIIGRSGPTACPARCPGGLLLDLVGARAHLRELGAQPLLDRREDELAHVAAELRDFADDRPGDELVLVGRRQEHGLHV